jgi:hypothetical protein
MREAPVPDCRRGDELVEQDGEKGAHGSHNAAGAENLR